MRFVFNLLILLFVTGSSLIAQQSISFSQTGETVTTPGSPFQAERVTSTSRTLPDGTLILYEESEALARDSEGRFYDESKQTSVGGLPPKQSNLFHALVDPVAKTAITWNSLSQRANMNRLTPTSRVLVNTLQTSRINSIRLSPDDKVTTEDLGKKTIAGLLCAGIRTSTVIPVGGIGNTRPLTLTKEVWTSSDLQMTVLEIDNDPLNGIRTSKFVTASRVEPPASLFHIPDDLTIKSFFPFRPGTHSALPPTP